jgi:hypothetical protein
MLLHGAAPLQSNVPNRVNPATTVPEIFLKLRSDIAKVDVLQLPVEPLKGGALRNIKNTAIGNQGEILPTAGLSDGEYSRCEL